MKALFVLLVAMASLSLTGCSTEPTTSADRQALDSDARTALAEMKNTDSSLQVFLNNAYGYATFPDIGKGAVGIGGAYGHGEVFEQGRMVGYADMTQGTIGAQIGGQEYSELIVFQTAEALNRFKSGAFTFAAQASAVAINAGAATSAKYENGVAVFVKPKGGLMAEASVGGQKFNFQPN